MFQQNSKLAVLESKLNIYEDLSREMLSKLESAVEKISEGNSRIATILTKHDERIEQSNKTDELIIKMVEDIKQENGQYYKALGTIVDLNLGFEYRYNTRVSAFLQFNNLAAQRYNRWLSYPVQGFQVMGGITARF